ncbi:ABC transporter permease [Rhodomicrobium lacus]|uniref:ABC transporter permease n=1 Tax=Rhodomicrobium lacus TaxID=2498452 RepID=UPI0026E13BA8|nr:ABC transporter permease [Rhodomicrobium lacus]WKW51667.1 ABC transporter permease [Rhodomicrobium lacus]
MSLVLRSILNIFDKNFSLIGILLIWQSSCDLGLISKNILASPLDVLASGWSLLKSGDLLTHISVSFLRALSGLALGVSLGTMLALLSGLSDWGRRIVDGPVQAARALPFLGLVPLFILWFGIGEMPKIALVALATTFPIYINLLSGIRGVDSKLMEAGICFGLSRTEQIVHVVLPGAAPSFLTGLRHALTVSWLSLVAAEQINATQGVGYLILQAREFLRTDIMLVGLTVYALLGVSTNALVQAIERRALAWRAPVGVEA